jgi:excisionase family DNA binding protein
MNQREYYSIFQSEPEVLTVHDVARLLRIGKNKAYSLVKSGRLKSIHIGGKTIVPKVNLIEFLVGQNSSCVLIENSEDVS